MEKETMIEHFCRLTGLSKRSLAAFLDTDQSLLSRVDSGGRSLPTNALLQMTALYKLATAGANSLAQAPPDPVTAAEKTAWCITQCIPLYKQLHTTQENCRQAALALQLLETCEKADDQLPPKKQRWITEQRYQAQKKLQANGWLPQKQLTIKIALLQHEAQLWHESIEENI
jgi:hypothetical protein